MTLFQSEYLRFNWLVPGVLAGGTHPELSEGLANIAPFLRRENIGGIVTLFDQALHPNPQEFGFRYLYVETANFAPPEDMHSILSFIESERQRGKGTLVHCYAGIGRTGTVLASWLLRENPKLSVDDAIASVRNNYLAEYARSRFPESKEQQDALDRFAESR